MPTKTFVLLNRKKQDLIFQAALEEFAECGYIQASTNTICKKAGISKGSMFQYFPNKEDLFVFVIRRALKEITYMYKVENITYNDSMELKEIFISACFQMIRFYEKLPNHYRLYLRVNYEVDYPDWRTIRRYVNKYVTAVTTKFIEIGRKKSVIRSDIRTDLAQFFINNMLFRLVELFFIPGLNPSLNIGQDSESRKNLLESVYEILLQGMGGGTNGNDSN